MATNSTKFIIVGFDGLRPDCVEKDMPNLKRFISSSHRWNNYLATFPTETYVNHPCIFSGFRPNRHGVIANAYYDRRLSGEKSIFRGNRVDSILTHDTLDNGAISVPSLGDRLGAAGKTMRVICANSSGSTRLQHMHADRYPGHLNCCVHDLGLTIPACEREVLQSKWGNGVPLRFPDFDGTKLLTDIFFEYELPRGLADVTVLWIGEPDHSSHEFGIFDERTVQARRNADDAFGKILHWWESEGQQKGFQLVTMSDHGHGEVVKHYDLTKYLRQKGWSVLTGQDIREGKNIAEADLIMVGTYALGLWLTQPTEKQLVALRDDLMQCDAVGLIFSQPDPKDPTAIVGRVAGTFSESVVFSDNLRGPDLRVVYLNNPRSEKLIMAEELPLGAGNHGGLLPQEIHSVLAVSGNAFTAAASHSEPAGHDDFAVTVMHLLGLLDNELSLKPIPSARLLTEALPGQNDNEQPVKEKLRLECGAFAQYIERVHYRGQTYVIEGARDTEFENILK